MLVTFLGTGTSRGVPVIGCDCAVCTSPDPKNKRLRPSVLIESAANKVVIDVSVDFRTQMLRYNVRHLDAVIITHSHVDHILGLDDLYPFNVRARRPMPVYASPATIREIKVTFRYFFEEHPYPGIPQLDLIPIDGPFRVGDLTFQPVEVFHGKLPVLGFRIGDFAYVTDVNLIPEEGLRRLKGVRYLVLDGLRHRSHPTHFSLSEAVEMAKVIQADQTFLIHMCHDVDHQQVNAALPGSVQLAYDGMILEV
ncbi:MAG: MBL fold metallo-hydrolase [Acidobacteria bacterium]|nr:MBL fold metallo-hydrolase [Acidobacteriota bacterium]